MDGAEVDRLGLLLRRYGKGQVLLFAGAGFSVGGTNILGREIPNGKALIQFFQKELEDDSEDLSILSQMYADKMGEHGLFSFISQNFQVKDVKRLSQVCA